jgi:hypothetical protein
MLVGLLNSVSFHKEFRKETGKHGHKGHADLYFYVPILQRVIVGYRVRLNCDKNLSLRNKELSEIIFVPTRFEKNSKNQPRTHWD